MGKNKKTKPAPIQYSKLIFVSATGLALILLVLGAQFFLNAEPTPSAIVKKQNASLPFQLPSKLKSELNESGIEVRKPKSELDLSYQGSPIPFKAWRERSFSENDVFKHPNLHDYESVVEINNHQYSKELIYNLRESLFETISQDPKIFGYMLGYHEITASSASQLIEEKLPGSSLVKLTLEGRYKQKIDAICGLNKKSKETLILLPGRGSDISALFGFSKKNYTNAVALEFFQKSHFNVCAVQIFSLSDLPLKRYGISGRGVSISSVGDFVHYLKAQYSGKAERVFIGGISNGGIIAEYAGVLDDKVDGVLSIGASARYDWPLSVHSKIHTSPSTIANQDHNYTLPNFLARNGNIFKLIFPKPLVISIGTHDAGLALNHENFPSKFQILKDIKQYYEKRGKGHCLFINLFEGGHSSDPLGEIHAMTHLSENCRS